MRGRRRLVGGDRRVKERGGKLQGRLKKSSPILVLHRGEGGRAKIKALRRSSMNEKFWGRAIEKQPMRGGTGRGLQKASYRFEESGFLKRRGQNG